MNIDRVTGDLWFANGTIGPRHDRKTFLATPFGGTAQPLPGGPGWHNYSFEPETGVRAHAYFHGDRLKMVSLVLSLPSESSTPWGLAGESHRKALHDELLHRELGRPPYFHSWGEIVSTMEPWTRDHVIDVRYDPPAGPGDRIKRRLRHWMRRLQEID